MRLPGYRAAFFDFYRPSLWRGGKMGTVWKLNSIFYLWNSGAFSPKDSVRFLWPVHAVQNLKNR